MLLFVEFVFFILEGSLCFIGVCGRSYLFHLQNPVLLSCRIQSSNGTKLIDFSKKKKIKYELFELGLDGGEHGSGGEMKIHLRHR